MALVLEDGTAKDDSNTYVLESTFITWLSDNDYTITGPSDALLLRAAQHVDNKQFIGSKYTKEQAMQWPREYAEIDGFDVEINEIPAQLIKAQMQCAYDIDQGFDPDAITTQNIKSEKVDVIEVEYQDNTSSKAYNAALNNLLRKLLKNGGGTMRACFI